MQGIEPRVGKNGTRYRAVVRAAKNDVRHGSWRGTQEDAIADHRRISMQVRGRIPNAMPITVGLAIRNHLQAADHRASTKASYERVFKLLPPLFTQQQITNINVPTCQAALDNIENVHARDKAAKLMGGAFKRAASQGLIPVSPMIGVQRPKIRKPDIKLPTRKQLDVIVGELAQVNEALPVYVRLAVVSGCRRGEMVGIRWDDLGHGKLSIRRAITEVHGKLIADDPKTQAGRRTINLGESTAALLESRRGAGYMFSHDGGESPWRPNYVTQAFGRVSRKLGYDVSVHSLRHYALTDWVVGGTDFVTAARRAGHQKPSVTMDTYGGFVDGADKEVAAKFDW